MSPLRARMIEDMTLAGLAEGTQKIYIQAVRRLAARGHAGESRRFVCRSRRAHRGLREK